MKRIFMSLLSVLGIAGCAGGAGGQKYEVEHFKTVSGKDAAVTLVKHGSLEIRYGDYSIQVDPVSGLGRPTDYSSEFPRADLILITHEHGDHLDKEAVEALRKEGTRLIANRRSADILGWGEVLENGAGETLRSDIRVDAVPAYNTTEGHLDFHPKGRDNGYVITLDGLKIYVAGDTEVIPEMASLADVDVAFLPVNQPYTMTVEQCVEAARLVRPAVLIPYHFGDTDLSGLESMLPGIEVRLRQMQ